jgi:hypothetical protein
MPGMMMSISATSKRPVRSASSAAWLSAAS